MPAGQWVDVSFPMTGIGYKVPAGHVLRVALSTAYWPWIWPQGTDNPIEVSPSGSHIEVPVRTAGVTELDQKVVFDGPVQPEPVDVQYPEHGRGGVRRPERVVSTDAVKSETLLEVDPSYGGTRIYPDGLHYDEDTIERYWIQDDDPTTARTESIWKVGLARPDMGWKTSLEATTRITCDASKFYVTSIITCWEGEEEFFHREWNTEIKRTAS
ncbi:CocE/NonD family hydrolase C-terminal non-catalytic domain-containing protein [Corynebacterium cystitidis]|uniref:X-Pro dipeptidyl-peptidase C-terminal non-catalytic domain-containing protein n=1 Tax=Corynebacterium cystitidis DSM 20524 TaxID=1121357 RepID=A0A1H9QQK9_9CORY|nr:CocE/NonD family hydrolase C-terminal non-catalytic domain-containing protein [Corynebacterium cystitidis]WJY81696.1 hypothetical protein CCYS_03655 [Corynebacterium cystitidis DSM 20524]SER62724.1 X-Pro dipeptidyl-peptidase C-terminal non-catalytic domain-containing protein [Corynebacterium cystitidis DSM 20524]SNV84779.1 X-Pro dipeptidyl-peptidase C-terminal non-catalytic domain [Corynebacterium cystitidis]